MSNKGMASIVLDILSIPQGNAGGHIAHLGGAFFGYLYVKQNNAQLSPIIMVLALLKLENLRTCFLLKTI